MREWFKVLLKTRLVVSTTKVEAEGVIAIIAVLILTCLLLWF
jgi:hypothetical protein